MFKLKPNFELKKAVLSILSIFLILGIAFYIFTFPFNHFFKPFVSGIGVLCSPNFLVKMGRIGPFLFEENHCQKSPLWQLVTLYGFFYFWVISFIIFLRKREKTNIDYFLYILIIFSTLLIIFPEFVYLKDIYPAHYRANTMFKFVYQAFIILSIACAYIITRIITNVKYQISNKSINWKFVVLVFIGSIGLFLVMVYPYFSVNSYFSGLKTYIGLDGISYLKSQYPYDYAAINWLNKNVKGQPVIVEAQGDSYTDYARISANTGLPTVLGWTVHEWLWRGTYDIPAPRIDEVKNIYENVSTGETINLIKKYNVKYVYIGGLEKEKYINLDEEKFLKIGKIVYQNQGVKIFKINPAPSQNP